MGAQIFTSGKFLADRMTDGPVQPAEQGAVAHEHALFGIEAKSPERVEMLGLQHVTPPSDPKRMDAFLPTAEK